MNKSFLDSTRAERYPDSVPPEESGPDALKDPASRDVFALGVLALEVMENVSDGELPHLDEFLTFANTRLLADEAKSRPSMSDVRHQKLFQSHDFLEIMNFLSNIPLKSKAEREGFFKSLLPRLASLPEETIAVQMAPLLLSRLVLLDETAVRHFIPKFLTPRRGEVINYSWNLPERRVLVNIFLPADESIGTTDATKSPPSVISEHLFQEHVIPILLSIFSVTDYGVRSVLLE